MARRVRDVYLTTRQVAALFRVSVWMVHEWKAKGLITPIGKVLPPGRSDLYYRRDIDDLRAAPKSRWSFEAPDVITTKEMADICGVIPSTVGRWARRGLVDTFRLPSGWYRFSREEAHYIVRKVERSP